MGTIEQSENPAIFQAFIEKFPDAPQRQLAELKLMMLSPSNTDSKDNPLPAPNTSVGKSLRVQNGRLRILHGFWFQ